MSTPTPEAITQRIYLPNVVANSSLTSVKFLSACFAGAAAGILGLENWLGFALFLSSTLVTSACIYVINCQGKPTKYLQGGITELVNPGQDNAFTFVLVWTLFYGLVHDNRNAGHVEEATRLNRAVGFPHVAAVAVYLVRFRLSRGTEIEKRLASLLIQLAFPFIPLLMSNTYALLQYDGDPLNHRFIDHEGRLAFTIQEVARNPNPVIRLVRESAWSQQHPTIMGPENSYFYLGPESTAGYIVYGSSRDTLSMNYFLRPGKREGSLSRYFRAQNGRDYKWRIGSHRMECIDGSRTMATWEVSPPQEEFYARLIIKPNAMPLVTEIVTSLVINRMALALGW